MLYVVGVRLLLAQIAVAAIALTACSNADSTEATDAPPTPAATTSSAPAEPTYSESETCRERMTPVFDVIEANRTSGLEFQNFDNRVDELTRTVDRAVSACSDDVENPLRRAMYKFTLASVQWDLCNSNSCMDPVIKNIREGLSFSTKSQDAAEKSY